MSSYRRGHNDLALEYQGHNATRRVGQITLRRNAESRDATRPPSSVQD